MKRTRKVLSAAAFMFGVIWLMSGAASAAGLNLAPTSIATSGTVTMSGNVLVNGKPDCPVPGTIQFTSGIFNGFNGNVPVDATGHFSVQVMLKPGVAPGTYDINARCVGGSFVMVEILTVTGLPHTGGTIGPLSDPEAVMFGFAMIVAGAATLACTRRRSVSGDRFSVLSRS